MVKALPDKWVRKAVFDAINNMIVDSVTVPCYDSRATSGTTYTLMTTQSNQIDRSVKCGERWENTTLIEVFVKYSATGNPGSRLLADNILDEVRNRTQGLMLDAASGLKIEEQKESYPNDLVTVTQDENVYRKFLRYELLIN